MIVNNILLDENNNKITINDLQPNSAGSDEGHGLEIVYAHVGIINENGFQLNEDSIEVTREKYPLLFEHNDERVEDVVGYVVTDGKPNENGEFVGKVFFYNTPQGEHAAKLVEDRVIEELSVSYFIKDFDYIKPKDDEVYINVKHAILKEISLVSVGADRNTKINNKGGTLNGQRKKDRDDEQHKDKSDNGEKSTESNARESKDNEVEGNELETPAEVVENSPGEITPEDDGEKSRLDDIKLNLLKDFID